MLIPVLVLATLLSMSLPVQSLKVLDGSFEAESPWLCAYIQFSNNHHTSFRPIYIYLLLLFCILVAQL